MRSSPVRNEKLFPWSAHRNGTCSSIPLWTPSDTYLAADLIEERLKAAKRDYEARYGKEAD